MKKALFIILVILLGSSGSFAQSGKAKTERAKLEGTWGYQDAQLSYIPREANKATEKLGEVDVTVQYEIRWKDGLNHDLVVLNFGWESQGGGDFDYSFTILPNNTLL